jgi:hypothetical protein
MEFGERVALRQVLEASSQIAGGLPRPRPRAGRPQVATQILDEDLYPVGGYVSISTRGTIESLLHSQLALMEKDEKLRPDLFDIRFLRDELLYYSRDENQFHRRRRTFVLALYPDLEETRIKDPQSPWQRLVLGLALVRGAIERIIDWLAADSLIFEIVFVTDGVPALAAERELLELILSEEIALGTVRISTASPGEVSQLADERARKSQTHLLTVSLGEVAPEPQRAGLARLRVDDARPSLAVGHDRPIRGEAEGPVGAWRETLEQLLESLID